MGKTEIPRIPWDSHGNGNKISQGMGMEWEWKLSVWEWEFRRGSGKDTAYCMKSLKWEGIGAKNLYSHISTLNVRASQSQLAALF